MSKSTTTITIEIPDDILDNFESIEHVQRTVYEDFIIEQRQKGNISLGKAAELLGITYSEFFDLLGEKGLSFINASKDEVEESYRRFKESMRIDRTWQTNRMN